MGSLAVVGSVVKSLEFGGDAGHTGAAKGAELPFSSWAVYARLLSRREGGHFLLWSVTLRDRKMGYMVNCFESIYSDFPTEKKAKVTSPRWRGSRPKKSQLL